MLVLFKSIFNTGARSLVFIKEIEMPAPPFRGMMLYDNDAAGNEVSLVFEDSKNVHVFVGYDTKARQFFAERNEYWGRATNPEVVDDTISQYTEMGWTRTDQEVHEIMKALLANGLE